MTRFEMQVFRGTGAEWNSIVAQMPGAHLLQTWEWAQVKAAYGWQAIPVIWERLDSEGLLPRQSAITTGSVAGAAMVLRRPVLSRGFVRRLCILYAPKGPVLDPGDRELRAQVLEDLEDLGRDEGGILVKIDPDIELGRGYAAAEGHLENPLGTAWSSLLKGRGWVFSDSQVQFRNSVWIDLETPADQLLSRMKQKTRYNIGLAERRGVTVRAGRADEFGHLYRMYAETANRDGFVIRDEQYYRNVWTTFLGTASGHGQPAAEVLVAEVAGEPVAALWLFHYARRAYYLYGMSSAAHRDKMPNYLLQWKAILRSKELGCRTYDLWGAPETFDDSDSMWGVFRFKEGLGGNVVRTLGAWDYPVSGIWYQLYNNVVPRTLDVLRWRGRKRVRETLGGA